MENPFNLTQEKLSEIMASFVSWLNSNPQEAKYPVEFRAQAENIRNEFLNNEVITNMSDEDFYNKIYKYSRSLEGPAYIRLGEPRIRANLDNLRRNLKYIISSDDSPFIIAQNILAGEYQIEIFAKAFWSPILHARFPGILPNWNNKTEKFLKKVGVNISTSKISISEKYEHISKSFKYLKSIKEDQDFFHINHLMHYGTVIEEGIELIDRMLNINRDPLRIIIKSYKEHIKKTRLEHEIYKWELVKKYQGKLDPIEPNFIEELKTIDFKNLIYPIGIAVRNHIANEMPNEYRDCFIRLFNEEEDFGKRVQSFMDDVLKVYRNLEPELGHHHDERTIATFLTYHNPEKYAFYKDSFYQKLCKLLGIKPKPKGEKYPHYMELIAEFRDNHIIPDNELIELVEGFMNPDCYEDENHLILAQDILYQMLDREEEIIEIRDEKIFKISMGEFSKEDMEKASLEKVVLVHKDTKAKGSSSYTQGEVFQHSIKDGDYLYLTHGNKGVQSLGMFIGGVKPCKDPGLADDGWLERSFVEIFPSINKSAYKSKKKWWTPNENSTCIEIPSSEIEEANKLLFKPYFNAVFKSEEVISKDEVSDTLSKYQITKSNPLNTILYGPPGTGKTYYTIDMAVKIVVPNEYREDDHEVNKAVFEKMVRNGQIVFTTFHQSMCYEDFIEGIKPNSDDNNNLTYRVEDGLFKQLAVNAAFEYVSEKTADATKSLSFSTIYDHLIEEVSERIGNDKKVILKLKSGSEIEIVEITSSNNFLLQHINGTRTYTVSRNRLEKLFSELPDLDNLSNINEEIRNIIGGSNSSAYWAVLKELRSYKGEVNKPETGRVYSYDEKAAAVAKLHVSDITHTGHEKKFVLVIDEINRGNVSQVFGELITLIEEDKRFGQMESLNATLPYSRSRFFVPPNLYIIGTMNTADRSVEALDTALRRRFSFVEKMPLYKLEGMDNEIAGVKISDLLETINNRIEKLVDRDHQIGHSYFLGLERTEGLMSVFRDKIIPLLQEYFYGNYEKIGLVLGSGFIDKLPDEKVTFARFPSDENEYNEKVIYRLNTDPLMNVEKFTWAIALLMNKEKN